VRQRKIVDLLGVAASVVSRMLKSMQLMGFVRRQRDPRDRRCLLVTMTAVGEGCLERAVWDALDSRVADRIAARGVVGDRTADPDAPEIRVQVTAFEDQIAAMRLLYDDTSPVRDPWRGGLLMPFVLTTLVDGRLTYDASA
jgi:hypothetical protein